MTQTTSSQRFWTRAWDRLASLTISTGGLLMIGSLVLIFLLIVSEAIPLFAPPKTAVHGKLPVPEHALLASADEYRDDVSFLLPDGTLRVVALADGKTVKELPVPGLEGHAVTVTAAARSIKGEMALGLSDGSATVATVRWQSSFEGATRRVDLDVKALPRLALDPAGRALTRIAFSVQESGASRVVASPVPGVLLYGVVSAEPGDVFSKDLSAALGGESVTALAFLDNGSSLCVGTASGKILSIPLEDPKAPGVTETTALNKDGAPVTALETLVGGQTLVAGDARGRVTGLLRVRDKADAEARKLLPVKTFDGHSAAITAVGASGRGKTFVSADENGGLVVHFGTNARTLARGSVDAPVAALDVSPKANSFLVMTTKDVTDFTLDAPHPEISFAALFGKQLYEGYDKPEYVWQSSGATDDFESKLSLVPLIFGTLKGTFYAMLFAVPIGLAAALYTSVFATPKVKRFVKPIVEIMAALPSVVLGFLAGLWLAPLIQKATVSTLLLLPSIPLFVLAGVFLFQLLPFETRQHVRPGQELFLVIPLAVLGVLFAWTLGPFLERLLFAGDFKAWLLTSSGLRYDARNSLVIAFAMGFAVIPIIFTISEDALSSVPEHLKAASLALGASPWQTAIRVILPTASAGIFSALMVGFGRAVGETMIVLMATGNTPILDWNIFNGMRTLAANIAVEIPEAPQGGTLYRVLFLAALLLFVITFLVNTLAEALRQRLRKKYTVI
jgi:phosphate transport system permease protein